MPDQLIDRIALSTTSPIRVLFDEAHGESWTISAAKAKEVNPHKGVHPKICTKLYCDYCETQTREFASPYWSSFQKNHFWMSG